VSGPDPGEPGPAERASGPDPGEPGLAERESRVGVPLTELRNHLGGCLSRLKVKITGWSAPYFENQCCL
jgi:hypothetical protein